MNRWIPPGLLLIAAAFLSPHLPRPAGGVPPELRRQDSTELRGSALGRVLGEFRTGLSDMLYVKADRYLHYGVGFDSHSHEHGEAEPEGHDHEGCADGCEHDHDHEEGAGTLIPQASSDFRGWIGDMEREVKPWQPPGGEHLLDDGEELIPLFRMMTLLDGGYIQGYQAGSYWISQMDPEAALEFLREGLDRNPESFPLHLQYGSICLEQAQAVAGTADLQNATGQAREYLNAATASIHRAAELALAQAGTDNGSAYAKIDTWQATGLSFAIELRYGSPEKAEARRKRYLAILPDNPALHPDR